MEQSTSPAKGAASRFEAGERVVMVDSRQRRFLFQLEAGAEFQTHAGVVPHEEIIGTSEGSQFRSNTGARYVALRPTLSDHVLKMPRGAQVVYPKDLGVMILLADIQSGTRVFESGVGSGALSAALLRAGADVTGYEIRQDFADIALKNVTAFCSEAELGRYQVEVRDAYESIAGPSSTSSNATTGTAETGTAEATQFDRAVLDLPEPWRVVPHLLTALRPGGILVAYNPSVVQVIQLRRALNESKRWVMAETLEALQRTWHVVGESVRPDHRMVAHTGFITHARLLAPSN